VANQASAESGIYGGVNAGWMGSTVDWAFNPAIVGAVNQSFSLSKDSAIFGVHAGYHYQFSGFVLGVEGALIEGAGGTGPGAPITGTMRP
jgi:hypothetical protein